MPQQHDKFRFSPQQKAFATTQLQSLQSSTDIVIIYKIGCAEQVEYFDVAISSDASNSASALTAFVVYPMLGNNSVWYTGRQGDEKILGPSVLYDSFEEVFMYGIAVTRAACERIAARLATKSPPHDSQRSTAYENTFTADEDQTLRELAQRIYTGTGLKTQLELVGLGPQSTAAGLIVTTSSGDKTTLGSLVKVVNSAQVSITVRGLQGTEIPGTPAQFSCLHDALQAAQPYFSFVSQKLSEQAQPKTSILGRLKRSIVK